LSDELIAAGGRVVSAACEHREGITGWEVPMVGCNSRSCD